MAVGLVLLVVVAVVAVMALRKRRELAPEEVAAAAQGHAVRRFFHYLLMLGSLVVTATGLSTLLGQLLETDRFATDDSTLARGVAFTVVGLPLWLALATWSRRLVRHSPEEASSPAWAVYFTLAPLVALFLVMTSGQGVLLWAVGVEPYSGTAVASLVVWGAAWATHWWVDRRVTPGAHRRIHLTVGSFSGLVMTAVGLAGLLGGALGLLVGVDPVGDLQGGGGRLDQVLVGATSVVVGAPVWYLYWLRSTCRLTRDTLWLAYVLLVGVGGGVVTALASGSLVLHRVLVWVLGEPGTALATSYFAGTPTAAGAAVVGLLLWWYHRTVLQGSVAEGSVAQQRTELTRVYEYLMAGLALVAAAVGLALAVVTLFEVATRSVAAGGTPVNTVLAAVTMLAVGGPVWWVYWRRIARASRVVPEVEQGSPTRRFYLFVLFGVAGVVALVALISAVYVLAEDLISGQVGTGTARSVRVPVGILLATGAVSGYHWSVFRGDRAVAPVAQPRRFVLLVGAWEPDVAKAVARDTGGSVQVWPRADDDGAGPWTAEDALAALGPGTGDAIVLAQDGALRAVPVRRRR